MRRLAGSLLVTVLIASAPPAYVGAQDRAARLAPPAGPQPGIRVREEVGARDVGRTLESVGAGLAGLAALTLLVELAMEMNASFFTEEPRPSEPPRPPAELSWAALGVLGGGLVLALIGVVLDVTAPPDAPITGHVWISPASAGVGLSVDL